jgi:enoyl-CoA hydratase
MPLINRDIHGPLAFITLNNPDKRNVLSRALVTELNTALENAQEDKQIKCIILRGEGKSFCAGADVREFVHTKESKLQNDFIADWEFISSIPKPIIACIHGFTCGGGIELMLMADYIIAEDSALFAMPEINLGLIPGCGGTQRLSALLGQKRAFEFCFMGRTLTAQDALNWGLVNEIAPEGALEDVAKLRADQLCQKSLDALLYGKQLLKGSERYQVEGFREERIRFWQLVKSDNGQEGVSAFLEKRPPNFQ